MLHTKPFMYKFFKTLHIIGLALAMGSIIARLGFDFAMPQTGDGELLAAYATAARLITSFSPPALGLTAVSGVAMLAVARLSPQRQQWLLVHIGIASGLALCVAGLAIGLASLHFAIERTLLISGVVLSIAASVVGVVKPRWRN
jgi:hypothetical protein